MATLTPGSPTGPIAVHEDGVWAIVLPGAPLAAEAATFEGAVSDFIAALREYAADWKDHLHQASNHATLEPLVHLVEASSDEQLEAVVRRSIVRE